MNKVTQVKLIDSKTSYSIDDFKTLPFYESVLKLLEDIDKSNEVFHRDEDLAKKYGDIAYGIILYLEESGFARGVAVKSGGKGVRFEPRKVRTIIPFVRLKIDDLKTSRRLNNLSIGIAVGAFIVSVVSLFL